jgi:hypothetical protein
LLRFSLTARNDGGEWTPWVIWKRPRVRNIGTHKGHQAPYFIGVERVDRAEGMVSNGINRQKEPEGESYRVIWKIPYPNA